MSQTITFNPDASPDAVARVEAARAKLKPCCMRCRKNLLKRELAKGRVCLNRSECTLRMIQRRPNLKLLTQYGR